MKPERHSLQIAITRCKLITECIHDSVIHSVGTVGVSRMTSLVGFYQPSYYGNVLIKPARKALDGLIVTEWLHIQPILASLA